MIEQKTVTGELIGWDSDARRVCVRFKKSRESSWNEAIATFALDPYAIVASAHRETLALSKLGIGQRVTVAYTTGMGGRPIAKTLVLSK